MLDQRKKNIENDLEQSKSQLRLYFEQSLIDEQNEATKDQPSSLNVDSCASLLRYQELLQGISVDFATVSKKLYGPNGSYTEVLDIMESIDGINKLIDYNQSVSDVADDLLSFGSLINEAEELFTNGAFVDIVMGIQAMNEVSKKLETLEDIPLLLDFRNRATTVTQNTFTIMQEALIDSIYISHWNIVVNSNVPYSDLVKSLSHMNMLEKTLSQVSEKLKGILICLIEGSNIEAKQDIGDTNTSLIVKKTSENAGLNDILNNITTIIEFLYSNTTAEVVSSIGSIISNEIIQKLIELVLSSYIPKEIDQINSDKIRPFIVEFQQKLKTLEFIEESNNDLEDYVNNFSNMYARNKRTELLAIIQNLLSRKDYESERLKTKESDIEGDPSPFKIPDFHISLRAITCMGIIYDLMGEFDRIENDSKLILYQTTRDIIEMWMAIMPISHGKKLSTIPQLAIIFHNDCIYFAKKMMVLSNQYRIKDKRVFYLDTAVRIQNLGKKYLEGLLDTQKEEFKESLKIPSGLGNASERNKFKKIDNCINQLLMQLTGISKILLDILPHSFAWKVLGSLANYIFMHFIRDMFKLKDISSLESTSLYQLLHKLTDEVGQLFNDEDNSINMYIPLYSKLEKISNMLDMRMVDIVESWNDNRLEEFNREEIKFLIQALFQNSDFRKQQIKLLK
eukprot:TRINITY_DN5771_c0_g1_i1.p1 TRINITY_DN5771_c0_g1~~TRINITY_DN5771_c0_g1_i1.p1  ORF type:complete len:680 (+),score=144.43 TRINITY_DN5771_c0_g1_i1:3-2042(+)